MANAPFKNRNGSTAYNLISISNAWGIWFLNWSATEDHALDKQSSEETFLKDSCFLNFGTNKHLWWDHLS